jgi:hypothetical protein
MKLKLPRWSFLLFCVRAIPQKMMNLINGQERTITCLRDLLDRSGWKLTAVNHDEPSMRRYQKVIAVPI